MKKKIFSFLTVCFSFLLFFVIAEFFLRITKFNAPHYTRPDIHTGARLMENAYYIHNKEGKSEGYINSKGIRDYEYEYEKSKNTYRILVFGDSYTEAMQVDLDSSFTKILERKLNEYTSNPLVKYEVLNMGMSGYGTANSYKLYTSEGIKYNADLVILAFLTGNDFRNNSKELDQSTSRPYFFLDANGKLKEDLSYKKNIEQRLTPIRNTFRILKNKSYLVSLIIQRKDLLFNQEKKNQAKILDPSEKMNFRNDWKVYLKEPPEVWEEAFNTTFEIIKKFKNSVNENGSKFLLVTLTNSAQISDKLSDDLDRGLGKDKYDLERPDKMLQKYSEENGITMLNLLKEFNQRYQKEGVYFHGFEDNGGKGCDCHWNYDGHRLAGEILYNHLKNNLLISED
ncbi:MAG: SGNH/GDSL hydrolase family protein [Calditrichaeota bacterium]|nr:MAG: SGNH/GDSL hydrolase family protein [Calditrichota bacterium]